MLRNVLMGLALVSMVGMASFAEAGRHHGRRGHHHHRHGGGCQSDCYSGGCDVQVEHAAAYGNCDTPGQGYEETDAPSLPPAPMPMPEESPSDQPPAPADQTPAPPSAQTQPSVNAAPVVKNSTDAGTRRFVRWRVGSGRFR